MSNDWPTIEPSPDTEPTLEERAQADAERTADRPEGLPGTTTEPPIDEKPLVLIGTPYIVDYYELGDLYEDNIDNMKERINLIDAAIKTRVLNKNWKPIVKSYKKALTEIEGELGLIDDSSFNKIHYLFYYFKGKSGL